MFTVRKFSKYKNGTDNVDGMSNDIQNRLVRNNAWKKFDYVYEYDYTDGACQGSQVPTAAVTTNQQ